MAIVVVFATTYALILPAITLTDQVAEEEPGIVLENEAGEIASEEAEVPAEDAAEQDATLSDEDGDASVPEKAGDEAGSEDAAEAGEAEAPAEDAAAPVDAAPADAVPVDAAPADAAPADAASADAPEAEGTTPAPVDEAEQKHAEAAPKGGVLTGSGKSYKITVTYGPDARIPEGAVLSVREIVDMDPAKKQQDPQLAAYKDFTEYVDEAENALQVNERVTFARFFDIKIMVDGVEYQPAAPVAVKIELNNQQLDDDVKAVHFGENDKVEVLDTSRVNETLNFEARGFSVYGVVGTEQMTVPFTAGDNRTYEVTVTYGAKAGIPADARFEVSELTEKNEKYDEYVSRTADAIGADAGEMQYVKLLDISIVNSNGEKVELREPVDVQIRLMDRQDTDVSTQVVHFAEEVSPQVIVPSTEGDTVSFSTDGFSVYAIVGTEEGDPSETNSVRFDFFQGAETEPQVYTFVNKEGQTTNVQYVTSDEKMVNPGLPTISAGDSAVAQAFLGWCLFDESTNRLFRDEDGNPVSFDFDLTQAENIARFTAAGATVGTTFGTDPDEYGSYSVKLLATYNHAVYAYYYSQGAYDNPGHYDVYAISLIPEGGSEDFTEKTYVPDSSSQAMLGWSTYDPTEQESARSAGQVSNWRQLVLNREDNIYGRVYSALVQTDDGAIKTASGTDEADSVIRLYPVVADVYWVTYDKNDWEFFYDTTDGAYNVTNESSAYVGTNNGAYVQRTATEGNETVTYYEFVGSGHGDYNPKFAYVGAQRGDYSRVSGGSTYVAPVYVLKDESLNESDNHGFPTPDPTWTGYTFGGWYTNEECTGTAFRASDIVSDASQAQNGPDDHSLTLYAKWVKDTTSYSVVIWKQSLADESQYDYAGTIVIPNQSHTGDYITSADVTAYTQYGGVASVTLGTATEPVSFTGFKYNAAKTAEQDTPNGVEVLANGTSVYNVYYDRQTYTLRYIYARSSEGTGQGYNYTYLGSANNGTITGVTGVQGNYYYTTSSGTTRVYWRNGFFRTSNNNNATRYTGEVWERTAATVTQYQVTETVNDWLHDNISTSWNNIQNGMSDLTEDWHNVGTTKPTITHKGDNYVEGSFVDGNYTYYYLDITGLLYGQNISALWPYNALDEVDIPNNNNTYKFTSWGTQMNSPYWNSKNNAAAGNNDGKFTIKGAYNTLDDLILNVQNNGTTTVNGGDILAHVFLGRYKTNPGYYNYLIYADLLEGQEGERTFRDEDYALYTSVNGATSTDSRQNQAVLAFEGLTIVEGKLNANNQHDSVYGGASAAAAQDVYYYYKRNLYTLTFADSRSTHEFNTYSDKYGESLAKYAGESVGSFGYDGMKFNGWYADSACSTRVYFSQPTDAALAAAAKDAYDADELSRLQEVAEATDATYTAPDGRIYAMKYVVYSRVEAFNRKVFAGWRNLKYRVWIQANGGQLTPGPMATYFNNTYGQLVGKYEGVMRNFVPATTEQMNNDSVERFAYVEVANTSYSGARIALYVAQDADGYYYYNTSENSQNSVGSTKVYLTDAQQAAAEATHQLDPGDFSYVYKYNGYTLVGWYQYRGPETVGNIVAPTIRANDDLLQWNFGEGVTEDTAIRAIWKRTGYLTVVYSGDGYALNTFDGTITAASEEDEIPDVSVIEYSPTDFTYTDNAQGITEMAPQLSSADATRWIFVGWITPDHREILSGSKLRYIHDPGSTFTIHADYADVDDGTPRFEGDDSNPDDYHFYYELHPVFMQIGTSSITYTWTDAAASTMTGTQLTDWGAQLYETPSGALAESSTPDAEVTVTEGNTISGLKVNSSIRVSRGTGFTRMGYRLIGWNDDAAQADAGVVKYNLGYSYGVSEEQNTLYAVWERAATVELTKVGEVTPGGGFEGAIPLENVSFRLHIDASALDNVASPDDETITTTADGRLIITIQPKYFGAVITLTETTAPEGYAANSETYTISEVAIPDPEDPTQDAYTITGNGGAETLLSGNRTDGYRLLNKLQTVDLTIRKTDAKSGEFLFDAQFELDKLDTTTGQYTEMERFTIGEDTIEYDTTGDEPTPLGLVRQLTTGQYRLVEKKAPDGYVAMINTIEFYVDAAAGTITFQTAEAEMVDEKLTITYTDAVYTNAEASGTVLTVMNTPGSALPMTGGHGTLLYTMSGLVLIAIAALMYGSCSRRRKRGQVD